MSEELQPEATETEDVKLSQKEQLAKLRGILADIHGSPNKQKHTQSAQRANTRGAASSRINTQRKIG